MLKRQNLGAMLSKLEQNLLVNHEAKTDEMSDVEAIRCLKDYLEKVDISQEIESILQTLNSELSIWKSQSPTSADNDCINDTPDIHLRIASILQDGKTYDAMYEIIKEKYSGFVFNKKTIGQSGEDLISNDVQQITNNIIGMIRLFSSNVRSIDDESGNILDKISESDPDISYYMHYLTGSATKSSFHDANANRPGSSPLLVINSKVDFEDLAKSSHSSWQHGRRVLFIKLDNDAQVGSQSIKSLNRNDIEVISSKMAGALESNEEWLGAAMGIRNVLLAFDKLGDLLDKRIAMLTITRSAIQSNIRCVTALQKYNASKLLDGLSARIKGEYFAEVKDREARFMADTNLQHAAQHIVNDWSSKDILFYKNTSSLLKCQISKTIGSSLEKILALEDKHKAANTIPEEVGFITAGRKFVSRFGQPEDEPIGDDKQYNDNILMKLERDKVGIDAMYQANEEKLNLAKEYIHWSVNREILLTAGNSIADGVRFKSIGVAKTYYGKAEAVDISNAINEKCGQLVEELTNLVKPIICRSPGNVGNWFATIPDTLRVMWLPLMPFMGLAALFSINLKGEIKASFSYIANKLNLADQLGSDISGFLGYVFLFAVLAFIFIAFPMLMLFYRVNFTANTAIDKLKKASPPLLKQSFDLIRKDYFSRLMKANHINKFFADAKDAIDKQLRQYYTDNNYINRMSDLQAAEKDITEYIASLEKLKSHCALSADGVSKEYHNLRKATLYLEA